MASSRASDPLQQLLPRSVVPRPALVRRLDAIRPGGLGLIVASAGSGKSVLVRQWSAARPELRISALAISPRHDDAVVFARDMIEAIRAVIPEVSPGVGELVMRGGSSLGEPFIEGLLGELAALPQDVVLVLEDAHLLTNRLLLNDLGRIAGNLPLTFRVIVTTRRDPPWLVHLKRLEGSLVEIRSADLAFRLGDARELLRVVSEHELRDAEVAALLERTEGWAVGLQLAAISLQRAPDIGRAIESFTGSDRLVAEYLLGEVIERQDPDVRRFLFQTAALEWLSVDLCDAVTGTGNARAMLEELDRRSLFLIPLDRSGEAFRYHHLFAELLRYRHRVEDPGAAHELHLRAARWLLDHGDIGEAIGHLLAAGDLDQAFEAISRSGHRFYERGESATLVTWLSAIEAARPDAPPVVLVSLLAAQLASDQTRQAAETYGRLRRRPDLSLGERTAADTLVATALDGTQPPTAVLKMIDDVRAALPQLEPADVVDFLGLGGLDSVQAMAEYAASVTHFLQGDLAEAVSTLERLLGLPGANYPVWRVYTLGTFALVRAWEGRCTAALRLADSALKTARALGFPNHSACTHAHMAVALVHLDRTELEGAERSLAESALQNHRPVSVNLQQTLAARLAAVTQGPTRALALLREPTETALELPVTLHANGALEARLLTGRGRLAEARALLDSLNDGPELAAARIDLALATPDVALARDLLDRWKPAGNDLRSQVGHQLRTCTVLAAEGDRRGALAALSEAVAKADTERLRWPFLEVPAALRLLRREARPRSPFTDDSIWDLAVLLEARGKAQTGLVEPLTERELAVLAYLPRRIKNHDIAADLFVSVNTVKTHLSNIYRKLGVAERDEAVARATELRLL